MHFSLVLAEGRAEELLASLSRLGTFRPGPAIATLGDAPETDAAGERVMIAGELDGKAYLFDPVGLVAGDVDGVITASEALGRRVLSIGAETTSGTYYLIVADRGQLVRTHWAIVGTLQVPYEVGEPVAGEPADGIDDVDGERLMAIARGAGFEYEAWMQHGRKVIVEANYGEPRVGPAGQAMNAYMEEAISGSPNLSPVVVNRGGGGFDLVAPGSRLPDGTRVQPGEKKPGLLGRLFGRG